jgi:light-regulated signal transduction histidine kinase (bacteriophytochrome)
VFFQDVTPLKQAELELQHAQEQLVRSNEELQQFAYTASHDLQEPLRMVSGYTQLLSRRYTGKLDADADEYIQFALEGANRMSQLLKDLLAFSRAGNPDNRRLERVAVSSVVQWAVLNLDKAIKECEAIVTHDELPSVIGDQARLAFVMQNLIGNAIKYRSADPPKIHVSALRQGESWVFCVADNGLGFEMKYAERIFGVFKRLHGKDFPGTGIGLAIARKVVEIHKGRMWAESEVGKGSRFYFTLPAAETEP